MTKVFVYGTLKIGEPNHYVMNDVKLGSAKLLARGRTKLKFPLVIGSRYNVPYLLYRPGTGNQIVGEVYEVDHRLFEFLDAFENYPRYYSRTVEDIECSDGSGIIKAWVYSLANFQESLLNEPFLANYESKGDHGREYVEADVADPEHLHYAEVQQEDR